MSDTLTCPNCQAPIEVTEALSAQLSGQIRQQVQAQLAARAQALEKQRVELTTQKAQLEQARQSLQQQVQEQLAKEREKLLADAKKKARDELALEMKDREQQLGELRQKLKTATDNELELRKRERQLAEKAEALELETARKLDQERDQLKAEAKKQAAQEHALRERENQKQIADLRTQIELLKRKAEQGSQQLQGEVLELELEGFLRRQFPGDEVLPVPKGQFGGDVLQRVCDSTGCDCGMILWESKRTRTFSPQWLAKLRDDQRAAKAAQAALVTEALPADCAHFAAIDGVWVTSWACVAGVATALRMSLIHVAQAGRSAQGKNTKMEVLYAYLASAEFRNRVTGIAEAFVTMRGELDAERRAMTRIWAKREKQLERAMINTSGLYGDLQGIFGGSLAQIDALTLPALEAPVLSGEAQGEGQEV